MNYWTPDEDRIICSMWGREVAAIARKLQGRSCQSISGRARRLGLPKLQRNGALRKKISAPLPSEDAVPSPGVKFDDLQPHHCRWPIGDPRHKDFHFCGSEKIAGLSYCAHHASIAFDRSPPVRRPAIETLTPLPAPTKIKEAV